MTVLGIRVGLEAVNSAERVLGQSPLHAEGDAASSREWRCWEAANGDGTTLYLARGEVHGELRLFGPEMQFVGRGTCPKSHLVHRGLATANGLRLGLTRAAIEKAIGRASKVGQGWYERFCVTRRRTTAKQSATRDARGTPFFISSLLRVVESEGKAVAIELSWAGTD